MNGRKTAIAVLIAVFLIGCLLGASGFWLWRAKSQSIPDTNDLYSQDAYSVRIFDRLQLTSDQKIKLQEILESSRSRINECRGEMQNTMSSIRIQTNERITSILDENQRSVFEQLLKESESHGGGRHHDQGPKTRGH